MSKIYEFTFAGHFPDNVETRNTLHYVTQVASGGSEPSAHTVLTTISDAISLAYVNCLPPSWSADFQSLTEQADPLDPSAVPVSSEISWSSSGS